MSLDLGTLMGYLGLDTSKWDAPLEETKNKTQDAAIKMPGWMMGASVGIAAAGIAIGAVLFKIGADFDEVSDGIEATTGATGKALDGLNQDVDDIAKRMPVSIGSIGPVVSALTQRLGLNSSQLKTVASQLLAVGQMTGQAVDLDAATGTLNAFNVKGADTSKVLDQIYGISQKTGTGFNTLLQGLQSAAPITQQLGFSLGDTAGLIGTMNKAGLDSGSMIGAMQRGLSSLAKAGKDPQQAFKDTVNGIQGMIDKGDEVGAINLAAKVFGTRGAAQFVGALKSGKINMDDLTGSTGKAGAGILKTEKNTRDFGESWQIFVNRSMVQLQPIATKVFGLLSQGMKQVTALSGPAFKWISANLPLLKSIAEAVAGFAATFVILTGALKVYNVVMGVVKAITIAGSAAQWLLNVAMDANPVGLVVIAIAALVGIIILLVTHWKEISAWLTQVWNAVLGAVTTGMMAFGKWWLDLWNGLIGGITTGWNAVVAWFTSLPGAIMAFFAGSTVWLIETGARLLVGFVNGITTGWSAVTAWFAALPGAVMAFLTGAAVWLLRAGVSIINGLVSGVKAQWSMMVAWFAALPGRVVGFISGAGSWLVGAGGNIINGLVSGVKNQYSQFMAFVKGIPKAVTGFFSGAGKWLVSAGKNIVQGLFNGISSLAGSIGNFFLKLLPGWIVAPFKAALGIHSPSTVFRGHGQNIVQGLLLGLGDLQPTLSARMGGLVSAPVAQYPSGAVRGAQPATTPRAGDSGGDSFSFGDGYTRDEIVKAIQEAKRKKNALAGLDQIVPVK